jgi:predicted PurR-regulated permease PerM
MVPMAADPTPSTESAIVPPQPATPAEVPENAILSPVSEEEAEVLHASIRAGSVAQVVVAVVAVLALLYVLKLVMVTALTAVLLAFILEPIVSLGCRIHIPRAFGALIGVALMLALALGLSYFFYSRALDFATELPKYSGKIRETLSSVRSQTNKLEESTRSVIGQDGKKPPVKVEVQQSPGLSNLLSEGAGTLTETLLSISFIPFLVYFMLTWKDHAHSATVKLFPKEHRMTAYRTISRITSMIRTFIAGNALIGLVNVGVSMVVFWWLGIPYFYFIAIISGFVSLIPYLGVFLALLPPLAGGLGVMNKTGVLIVFATVIALHIVTMNVLYPAIVGKRLRLNPLAVTLSLLFWAWIWGGMGLILAVPIVGATKVICDYVDSLRGVGAWLGE